MKIDGKLECMMWSHSKSKTKLQNSATANFDLNRNRSVSNSAALAHKWLFEWSFPKRINFPCNMMNWIATKYKEDTCRLSQSHAQYSFNEVWISFHFISFRFIFFSFFSLDRVFTIESFEFIIIGVSSVWHTVWFISFFPLLSIINLPAHLTFGRTTPKNSSSFILICVCVCVLALIACCEITNGSLNL